jgi:hypothetical protein
MEAKGIYTGEVVKFGWRTMRDNVGFFIGLLIVAWLVQSVPQLIASLLMKETVLLGLVLYVLAVVLNLIVGMGVIKISLTFCDGQKGTFGDLFSCYPLFFKYLLSSILYGLIVIAGTILLVFPAVIWGIKFSLFSYFIVDKGLGPVQALRASAHTTAGAKWDLLGFFFVVSVINFIGMVCLGIGLFATVPTTLIASALVYRRLVSQTETAADTP